MKQPQLIRMFGCVLGLWWGATVLVCGQPTPKIPGAGGTSSAQERIVEGTLDKYDSTLNKITIKGIDEDRMTLDTVPSLKAKDGTRRVPMATIKPGQKVRLYYVEKAGKKLVKDVEAIRDEPENQTPRKGSTEKAEPTIPGSP